MTLRRSDNRLASGQMMPLMVVLILVVVVTGVGIFTLVACLGASKELQNIVDAGTLNVAKQLPSASTITLTPQEQHYFSVYAPGGSVNLVSYNTCVCGVAVKSAIDFYAYSQALSQPGGATAAQTAAFHAAEQDDQTMAGLLQGSSTTCMGARLTQAMQNLDYHNLFNNVTQNNSLRMLAMVPGLSSSLQLSNYELSAVCPSSSIGFNSQYDLSNVSASQTYKDIFSALINSGVVVPNIGSDAIWSQGANTIIYNPNGPSQQMFFKGYLTLIFYDPSTHSQILTLTTVALQPLQSPRIVPDQQFDAGFTVLARRPGCPPNGVSITANVGLLQARSSTSVGLNQQLSSQPNLTWSFPSQSGQMQLPP